MVGAVPDFMPQRSLRWLSALFGGRSLQRERAILKQKTFGFKSISMVDCGFITLQ